MDGGVGQGAGPSYLIGRAVPGDESSRGKLSSLPTVERSVSQGVGPFYLTESVVEASDGSPCKRREDGVDWSKPGNKSSGCAKARTFWAVK